MTKAYMFDVDECLEISNGPITIQSLKDLHEEGHIVGLCGRLAAFIPVVPDWHRFISVTMNFDFGYNGWYGLALIPKHIWLHNFMHLVCPGLEEYVLVGNQFGRENSKGFKCGSQDDIAAKVAGWRFILEDEFAEGKR